MACLVFSFDISYQPLRSYFGAFSEDILSGFFQSFEEWELTSVLDDLGQAGLHPVDSAAHNLVDVPPALVYRMVSNWKIFTDPRILIIIRTYTPPGPLETWPLDPLPPGMFVLLMDASANVRQWAKSHASRCQVIPMSSESFIGSYHLALGAIAEALEQEFPPSMSGGIADWSLTIYFALLPVDLWAGFLSVLRLIPINPQTAGSPQNVTIRRIVTGHLHDVGSRESHCLILV